MEQADMAVLDVVRREGGHTGSPALGVLAAYEQLERVPEEMWGEGVVND